MNLRKRLLCYLAGKRKVDLEMFNNRKRVNRLVVALTAAAALATMNTATAPVASAQAAVGQVGSLDPTDIDMSATGTVTVHKTPENPNNDSRGIAHPIADRKLILMRLGGLEINTVAGFKKARDITLPEAQKLPVEEKFFKTTDSEGIAVFSGLKPGLYILGEKQPEVTTTGYYSTAPTLFTVPIGADEGKYWAYDFELDTKDQLIDQKPGNPPGPSPTSNPSGSSIGLVLIPVIVGGIIIGSASSGAMEMPAAPAPSPSPTPTPTPTETPVKGIPKKGIPKDNTPKKGLARTGANVGSLGMISILIALAGAALIISRRFAHR